jgi:hypothetical protein
LAFRSGNVFLLRIKRNFDGFEGGERKMKFPSVLAQEAATALSSVQESAAKSALCSAVASKFPNLAGASPAALTDPGVLSTAASMFAGSTHVPLPSATDMIKAYAMQHASSLLGSCTATNATSGMVPQIPGASGLPSIPKLP